MALTPVVAGNQVVIADLNQVISFLNLKARFRAHAGAAISPPLSSVWAKMAFDNISGALDQDPGGNYSTVNSRFTCPAGGAGTYRFYCSVGSGNSLLRYQFYKNGVSTFGAGQPYGGSGAGVDHFEDLIDLAVGDYVEVWATNTTTSAVSLNAGNGVLYWLGHIVGLN